MKAIRWIVSALVFALAATGCILISGQFLIDFDLPNFQAQTSGTIVAEHVNLNEEEDYLDHKDELQDLIDLAVLGRVTNNGNAAIGVEVWGTADSTNYTSSTLISQNAVKVWGPFVVLPGAQNAKTVGWDESAALFTKDGKKLLVTEIKGDGKFTLYAVGNTTNYDFSVDKGVLALVLDFAK